MSLKTTAPERRTGPLLWAGFALFYLNTLLTFDNRPSTPWPSFSTHLSIELLLAIGVLAVFAPGTLSRVSRLCLAVFFSLAVLLRYLHLTTLGVLGRPFDLNADLPHVGNVASMMSDELPTVISGLVLLLPLLAGAVLILSVYLGIGALARVLGGNQTRRAALLLAVASGFLFSTTIMLQKQAKEDPTNAEWDPWQGRIVADQETPGVFATPISVYAVQQLATLRATNAATLDKLLPATSNFRLLENSQGTKADVLLIFLESYGVTLIEDDQHFPYIEARFRHMEENLTQEGYSYASTQARSPTFGGGSWRAHATMMSGLRLDNEKIYDLLLSSDRPSMPHLLAEHGYRTIAAEPGIREEWPEADYFEFDKIYDANVLDYRDKEMGWWKIPDQYTLHAIERQELAKARPRPPVFAKISLIMSHIPYAPIPPVVSDWQRFDQTKAFEQSLASVGADDYRDLTELSIRYVAVFQYELDILERFLIERLDDNTLVIVSGDHQPPKLATHDSKSWSVPLHVFSRRAELVEGWRELGFEPTLTPGKSNFAMEDFLQAFCQLYDQPKPLDRPGS